MSVIASIFADASLKLRNYPAPDVLAAAVKAFSRGDVGDAITVLQKNPAALSQLQDNGHTLFENALRNNDGRAGPIARAFPDILEAKDPQRGTTLLMRLAEAGERVMFLRLAGMGASLQARDNDNNTIMHYAALSDGVDIMLEASKLGIGKNPVNNFGQTPLMHLSRTDKKAPGAVAVYLSSGFKLNTIDNNGLNPTMHAIQNLRLDLAIDLMNAGGEVDFDQAEILTPARALAHKQTVGGGDFMAALAKRHGIQTADAAEERKAQAARDAAAAAQTVVDVVDSLRNGAKRKPTLKAVRFKAPDAKL